MSAPCSKGPLAPWLLGVEPPGGAKEVGTLRSGKPVSEQENAT